ncbi:MAG: preprotein translocase subunit YajC [Clostridia bacterium]|nr:preprotein translocase subunit YajC [Clostridia bacterium]
MLSNLLVSIPSVVLMVVLFGLIIVWMVFSKRSQAKRQQETMDMLNAIKPGNKVKTIGGICGIVVEVCPEDNTFVLETGTENSGKSYIKFDKQAVYQTDAVVEKAAPVAPAEEAKAEEVFEETKAEEKPAEEVAENTEETK